MTSSALLPGYGPDSVVISGPDPKYAQLASILAARIVRGDFPDDQALPSGATLRATYGVSLGTAQRAVALLAEHGYVRVSNGKGAWPTRSHT